MSDTDITVRKTEKLYEGKAKILYATNQPGLLIQHFKDDATAFNGQKKGVIAHKGAMNNAISSGIFERMEKEGIRTHFVARMGERDMLVRQVTIIPIEVVVRNIVAGSLAKRLGKPTGMELSQPVLEFYYKDDALGDPMINDYHIRAFGLASEAEVAHISREALKINQWLIRFFDSVGVRLVDYKLEFGRAEDGAVLLADEISPDGCRLWDKQSGEIMDKDRFRQDLGRITEAYEEMARRVNEAR